jgi:hypothetical protein
MQRVTFFSILKRLFYLIRQKFCMHDFAYAKTKLLIGRPHSIFICRKCGYLKAQKYTYDCELR